MLGTEERNQVRTEEKRYQAYRTSPRDYFEDGYFAASQNGVLPRDDAYQDYLWDRLNSANPTYADQNSYFNPPIRGSARPVSTNAVRQEAVSPFIVKDIEFRKKKETKQLSKAGKVILAVYLAVVVLIATLVIVNSGFINTGSTAKSSGAVEIVAPEAKVSEGLYMMDAPNAEAAVETNGFDKFADKLSK